MPGTDLVPEKLDTIISLLQDLIALEACKADANRHALARALGVKTARISKISKALPKKKEHK